MVKKLRIILGSKRTGKVLLVCVLLLSAQSNTFTSKHNSIKSDSTVLSRDSSISQDTANYNLKVVPDIPVLYNVASKHMGRWAHLFLAIKIEESGNSGKYSWLAKKHFNLCGMRFPRQRRTYAVAKTNTNYAIYRNWYECVLDFKLYMDNLEVRFQKVKGREAKSDYEMLEFMFNSYNHFETWKINVNKILRGVHKKYPN
jgi:hypothetical protein